MKRILIAGGCLVFLVLALKMGAESLRARSAGSTMNNWKGGTMTYQDGFKLTAAFIALAGYFFYGAARTERK